MTVLSWFSVDNSPWLCPWIVNNSCGVVMHLSMSSPTLQVWDMWGIRRGFELETLLEGRGI